MRNKQQILNQIAQNYKLGKSLNITVLPNAIDLVIKPSAKENCEEILMSLHSQRVPTVRQVRTCQDVDQLMKQVDELIVPKILATLLRDEQTYHTECIEAIAQAGILIHNL